MRKNKFQPPWSAHLGKDGLTKVRLKSVFLDLRKNVWRYSLALKISFLALFVSSLNSDLELCSCKIDLLIDCLSSNLRWPSRVQFLRTPLKFSKSMHFCKLFKCYSNHFLISLSISDFETLAKRVSVLYALVHAP